MAIRQDEGKTHKLAVEKAIRLFQRTHFPLYLGQIALEVSFSLDRTLKLVGELVDDGVVRALTIEEKKRYDIDHVCDVYTLIVSLPIKDE